MKGRMPFALGPADGAPHYGFATFRADARKDDGGANVRISEIRIEDVDIPLAPDEAEQVRTWLRQSLAGTAFALPVR